MAKPVSQRTLKASGKSAEISQLRSAVSALMQRGKLANRAGITFHGKRDIYEVLGYQRVIRWNDLASRFERNGVAQRIVTAPPKATWRTSPEIIENEDPNTDTPFEQAFIDLAKQLKLFHYLERVDVISGIGRYGVLFLGGPGSLDSELRKGKLLYLAAYSEESAPVMTYEHDPSSPRFGLPSMYRLNFGADLIGGVPSPVSRIQQVHWSRVIHVAENLLEDEIFGRPRMMPVWNYLDDLDKVVGATGEAFWLNAYRGLQADVDKELTLNEDDAKQLSDEIDEYLHNLRRFIRTQGITMTPLGATVADPVGSFKSIISLISGTTGIPQRVLLGADAGVAAGLQDAANWNELIAERQKMFAEEVMLRPFVDRGVEYGFLPKPKKPYQVKWPDLLALSETERSLIAMRYGASNLNVSQAIASGTSVITSSEARERLFNLPPKMPTDPNEAVLTPDPALIPPSVPPAKGQKTNPQNKPASGKGPEKMKVKQ